MVHKALVAGKLESLMRCVKRIEAKRPQSLASLQEDLDIQDIMVVNLERAVQICVDLCLHWLSSRGLSVPPTMAETFSFAAKEGFIPSALSDRLARAVGFRNIAVHQYEKIDWAVVFAIAWKHIDDFRDFSGYMANTLIDEH